MLMDRAHVLLKDDRKDLRIKDNTQVPWQIKYKQRHGLAKIRNISAGGMLIETDRAFDLKDECIFSFDSDQGEGTYIPQVGRLVWHKRKRLSRNKYLCGIKFVEADEKVLQRMRLRVASGVRQFVNEHRIASITGLALCTVFVGLMGYIIVFSTVIYNDVLKANEEAISASNRQALLSQSIINLNRGNEIKLADASEKLVIASRLIQEDKATINLFSQELEATKTLLAQTETMLIDANDRNVAITTQLQAYQGQTPAVAAEPQTQRVAVGQSLGDGSIDSIEEARSLLAEYKAQVTSVKSEMRRLQSEERAARDATISLIENQRLQLGNNGFITRDGEHVWVDESQFQSLTIGNLPNIGKPQAKPDVEIDIKFVE